MKLRLNFHQSLFQLRHLRGAGLLHLEQMRALRGHPIKQRVFHQPGEMRDQTLAHQFGRSLGPLFGGQRALFEGLNL